jgi:hypothetical protein
MYKHLPVTTLAYILLALNLAIAENIVTRIDENRLTEDEQVKDT